MGTRTPSQRPATVFNLEVDLGSDFGSLCSLYPMNRNQRGERHKQQRVSKTTKHNVYRLNLKKSCQPEIWEGEDESCVVAGFGISTVITWKVLTVAHLRHDPPQPLQRGLETM